jgi:hypothetical protein
MEKKIYRKQKSSKAIFNIDEIVYGVNFIIESNENGIK